MIIVNKTLVSKEIVENCFSCDLMSCKGSCCVEGNGGAPIEKKEIKDLKKSFKSVKKYLAEKNLKEIKKQGFIVMGQDGDIETPLINGRECVYSIKNKNGIVTCAFEKAFRDKKTNFKKPISCELYPIRINKLSNGFTLLNYHKWNICAPACSKGINLKIPIYRFLKSALIRKFGTSWYNLLTKIVKK
tara:strand:+ start:62 stop:625 length:564 start_codon:yes stop_codon:yes gene_type:complete